MILRTATAAGLEGVVLPHQGVPDVGPLVIKASAGVAYRASILRSQTAEDALQALQDTGFALFGLGGEAERTIYDADVPNRAAFLLGSETHGVSEQAGRWVHEWLRIPMAGGVESLNVSSAATALAFELVRRGREG
jgi:23S rRNA (guanosine2251-2'-O)-methyltransferase